jgi:hypothetical protein
MNRRFCCFIARWSRGITVSHTVTSNHAVAQHTITADDEFRATDALANLASSQLTMWTMSQTKRLQSGETLAADHDELTGFYPSLKVRTRRFVLCDSE